MEKMMNMIKPKPNPQQLLRDWQRRLRQECRSIERQIRDIQREEKNVQKAIKEAAKRNDMGSAKAFAFVSRHNIFLEANPLLLLYKDCLLDLANCGYHFMEFIERALVRKIT